MPIVDDSDTAMLRKYESAYRLCCKKLDELDRQKSVAKRRSSSRDSKNRPLNGYQKHVREEFCKSKYDGMTPAQRMRAVSQTWKSKSSK